MEQMAEQYNFLVDHDLHVLQNAEKLQKFIVDAETGQRGFVITGQDEFLDPYNSAISTFDALINEEVDLINDNSAQVSRLNQIKTLFNKWNEQAAIPEIAARRDSTFAYASTLIASGTGKQILDNVRDEFKQFIIIEQKLEASRAASAKQSHTRATYTLLFTVAFSILASILLSVLLIKSVVPRITELNNATKSVFDGHLDTRVSSQSNDEIGELSLGFNEMIQRLEAISKSQADDEWLKKGLIDVNDIFRNNDSLKQALHQFMNFVTPLLNGKVGAFYLSNGDGLELIGGYALSDADLKTMIGLNEGTGGQALSRREIIVLSDLPKDYLKITSLLGDTAPKVVTVIPLFYQELPVGVLEIGTMNEMNELELEFLREVSENLAVSINILQNSDKIKTLLINAQDQNEELENHTKLLQSSEEELKAQHEELQAANTELDSQAQKLMASEEELKSQQEELMQSNGDLEEKGQLLEEKNKAVHEKNEELETASNELASKAEELALSSKYKSEFLANMSHELRTPLNSILLLSKLLSDNNQENLSDEQIEFASVIHNSGNGLLELINEILDLSKIESGKMELDINEFQINNITKSIQELFDPVATQQKLKFSIDQHADVPKSIVTDRLRLDQILKNFISNALKFTEKGKVELIIRKPLKTESSAYKSKAEELIVFEVKDTGIGIPADKHTMVFEAFQQADGSTRRKYGGTGLGLSISREIAHILGGEIILESTVGEGSSFVLIVPLKIDAAIIKDTSNLQTSSALKSEISIPKTDVNIVEFTPIEIPDDRLSIKEDDKTILIVEDDTSFAMALIKHIRKRGYKAVVAVSGGDAVDYASKYTPVGILLDIQLPVKSGWSVMKELKNNKLTQNIPVHMMSSHSIKAKETIEAGAIDFINKPLAQKELGTMLDKIEAVHGKMPKKILLVDDNEVHILAMTNFIGSKSITCYSALSAKEAYTILEEVDIDCVVLDMGLPDETGYQVLEKIKKKEKFEKLPVIIYTGRSLSIEDEKKLRQYANAIIIKTAESFKRLSREISLFLHLVEDKEDVPKSRKPYIKDVVLENKRVLVVDDDPRNIFSLTKLLESQKMIVDSANDGEDAIDKINNSEPFDIILMDMMMPNKDGYIATKEIRDKLKMINLPIIAVTAKAMLGDRDKCIQAGANDYITKPIDSDQLTSLIRVWINKS